MKIINEQALSRSDVIDKCLDYGKVFVEHFIKVILDFENNSDTLNHHIQEMQSFWDKVKILKFKNTNKLISNSNLMDWFFTVGSDVETILPDSMVDLYEEFMIKVLSDRDRKLIEIFHEMLET